MVRKARGVLKAPRCIPDPRCDIQAPKLKSQLSWK